MAKDIFGYNKNKESAAGLLPPGAIIVTIDDNQLNLAQEVRVEYARDVTPVYELGSENVYMVAGKSAGTCTISRMIGDAFKGYLPNSPCDIQNISITRGSAVCGTGSVSLHMQGMIKQVGFVATAGQLTVTDSATFQITSLTEASQLT